MSSRMLLVHDDGRPEINIVIHGYSLFKKRAAVEDLFEYIGEAELAGRVYLCSWDSGGMPAPAPLQIAVLGVAVIKPAMLAVPVIAGGHFLTFQKKAEKVGRWLANRIQGLKKRYDMPVTLIGHSLGGRVVQHCLLALRRRDTRIRRAIVLGGAASVDRAKWQSASKATAAGIVNVYSTNDWVLRIKPGTNFSAGHTPIGGVRKIRNVKLDIGHLKYFPKLDWVLRKTYPKRGRSKKYRGRISFCCGECDALLEAPANTFVKCPDCDTEQKYVPSEGMIHYYPDTIGKDFECPRCGAANKAVGDEHIECCECKTEIWYSLKDRSAALYTNTGNATVDCPRCAESLVLPVDEWVVCPNRECRTQVRFKSSDESLWYLPGTGTATFCCPWCDEELTAPVDEDVYCPVCRNTFVYRGWEERIYWVEPREVECPKCKGATVLVQDSGRYQCKRCRRWSEAWRDRGRISWLQKP